MIDLKEQYGRTYRITFDESAEIDGQTRDERRWLYQIDGKHGHIYVHGTNTLGAYVRTYNDNSNRLGRLLEIPGAKLHQRGDREASVTFNPTHFAVVAKILKLRKRKQISPERAAEGAERLKRYRESKLIAQAGTPAFDA